QPCVTRLAINPDECKPTYGILRFAQMRWRFGDDDLKRWSHACFLQMASQSGAIAASENRMGVHTWPTVGADGDIPDQRSDLDLLLHRDHQVGLGLPVEKRELADAQCADTRNLRCTEALVRGELQEAAHRLIPGSQDDRECALTTLLVQKLGLHGTS